MKRLWPFAVLALAALVVWSPTLRLAAPGDSFGYDLEWSGQFSRLFLAGHLYPRWMPGSFEGLGSPAFYFYPPLPFFAVALISGVTGAAASTALQLKLGGLVFFVLSGWTMYAWLRANGSPARALVGALVYLAAPYHFDDHFLRGDLAEFAAMALLPLVALGLKQAADGAKLGPPLLAASYAGLILAHLPLALLASILMIAPYGVFLAWRAGPGRARAAVGLAAGLGLGAALAAVYLAPALQLQGAISADYWWSARFHAVDGVFTNPHAWSSSLLVLLAVTAIAEGGLALGLAALKRNAETLFWAAAAVGVLALLAGVAPSFWTLPLVSKVQFPWRAMALEEFALVTVLALAPALDARRTALVGAAMVFANPALLALAPALGTARPAPAPAQAAPFYAPEYLPAGALRIERGMPAPEVSFDQLARAPLVAGAGVSGLSDALTGAVTARLTPGPARTIVARRFYFPAWRAACDGRPVAVRAIGRARLASFTAPAGAVACTLAIGATPEEALGAALSLASLLLLVGWLAWTLVPRLDLGVAKLAPEAS